MGNIIFAAAVRLLEFIEIVIFARVIISWLPISRDNQIIRILYQLTEPILAPIRNLLNRSSFGSNMMIDLSPVIAFLLIDVLKNLLSSLYNVNTFIF